MQPTVVNPANEAVADLQKALLKDMGGGPRLTSAQTEPSMPISVTDRQQREQIREPGGFRRFFLNRKASVEGIPFEQRPVAWKVSTLRSLRPLVRVGYFNNVFGIRIDEDTGEVHPGAPPAGESGVCTAALAIFKGFVGSGITFMPGAFEHGGWLFCSVACCAVGLCNAVGIRLLLDCRERTNLGSFPDIAFVATGAMGKVAVQISLVASLFSGCVTTMIYIMKMVAALGYRSAVTVTLAQLVVLVPLSFIRSVERLEVTNLVADVLVLIGLGVVTYSACAQLSAAGGLVHAMDTLPEFKPSTCGLFVGTIILTFEGLPMILPIRDSMREPEKFWPLFKAVFPIIVLLFASMGSIGYLAYGDRTSPIILSNLAEGSAVSSAVRVMYTVALLFGFPLMFLPAQRVVELWIFGVTPRGKKTLPKNLLRSMIVALFGVVAVFGGEVFDQFLAITGAFCGAPIAFIYPALFHMKLCANNAVERTVDVVLIVGGLLAMAFAFYQSFLTNAQ